MPFTPQVEPSHYRNLVYDSKERYISYWHQIQTVVSAEPSSVLEIGIGNGFVHRELRRHGMQVTTLDADARLEPDVVGSVTELPFDQGSFDLVCCFETLEHLPWDQLAGATSELARVSSRWVLVSLPDVTPYVSVEIRYGFERRLVDVFHSIPAPNPKRHEFNGEHYWEIGKEGYPLPRVVQTFEHAGLVVDEDFRVREFPYHHFFKMRVS